MPRIGGSDLLSSFCGYDAALMRCTQFVFSLLGRRGAPMLCSNLFAFLGVIPPLLSRLPHLGPSFLRNRRTILLAVTDRPLVLLGQLAAQRPLVPLGGFGHFGPSLGSVLTALLRLRYLASRFLAMLVAKQTARDLAAIHGWLSFI